MQQGHLLAEARADAERARGPRSLEERVRQRREAATLFPGAGHLRVSEDAAQEALRGMAAVGFGEGGN